MSRLSLDSELVQVPRRPTCSPRLPNSIILSNVVRNPRHLRGITLIKRDTLPINNFEYIKCFPVNYLIDGFDFL